MRQCVKREFCVSYGDWASETHAAAVPLFRDPDFGRACFALNCGIPAFRLRPGELEADIAPRLVQLAKAIRVLSGRVDATESHDPTSPIATAAQDRSVICTRCHVNVRELMRNTSSSGPRNS